MHRRGRSADARVSLCRAPKLDVPSFLAKSRTRSARLSDSASTNIKKQPTEPPSLLRITTSRSLRSDARSGAFFSARHDQISSIVLRNRPPPLNSTTSTTKRRELAEPPSPPQLTTSRQLRADARVATLPSAADEQNIGHGSKRPAPAQESAWATPSRSHASSKRKEGGLRR